MYSLVGDSNQSFNLHNLGNLKFRSGMIPFAIKGSKLVGAQYALGPLQHIAHSFAVVAVGHLVVDR